ncbi:MAG: hypothetical protein AB7T06_18280 [Kofleriaceae bacterium]
MSKPIEDPPSLVDVLAREHAARRALIEAEAAHVRAMVESAASASETLAADTHVEVHGDTEVDIASTCIASEVIARDEIVASPARPSSPRILVEELTRKCCERRAALDEEARRR